MGKASGRITAVTSVRTGFLTIDGITVWTNLTYEDLKNPALWTLRTPAQWARAVAASTTVDEDRRHRP